MGKLKLAVIIGSTRETRFGAKPAQWIFEKAQARPEFEVELLDLKTFELPLFNEVASNMWKPSQDPKAIAWQQKVATFDAFVVVTPEYNHGPPGALKNALDQAYKEWVHKPIGFVGYGAVGAARAIEHLRGIAVELQMVPVRNAVHISGADFMAVGPMGKNEPIVTIEANLARGMNGLFDDLVWWGNATKTARG